MPPTCWFPEETKRPTTALSLLWIAVRLRGAAGARAETAPAGSRISPPGTVAVTPLPTLGDPEATFNRNLPPLTASELLLPSDSPPSISSVPLLDLASPAPAPGVAPSARATVPAKAVFDDWFT